MVSIYFDKDQYTRGEEAKITYVDSPTDGWAQIVPRTTYSKSVSGSGTDTWLIPINAPLGQYTVELWARSLGGGVAASDTMEVVSEGAPPTPPPTGFTDTGKITPAMIEVEPSTYDVMFKISGYKDRIVSNVIVSEGATKSVSVTLELEAAPPPGEGYLTVNTTPTGALVMVNGVSCGTTPVIKCALSTGSKTITFTKSGYETATRAVTIRAGETKDIGTITLTPTAAPPVKKEITFTSYPAGATIAVVKV
ncbi:PEGA domain-containing protein [candidate division WOR-3 bacterium]|nr:PEGA domain-containing protein [candidate division WOR-3 bacterium]